MVEAARCVGLLLLPLRWLAHLVILIQIPFTNLIITRELKPLDTTSGATSGKYLVGHRLIVSQSGDTACIIVVDEKLTLNVMCHQVASNVCAYEPHELY